MNERGISDDDVEMAMRRQIDQRPGTRPGTLVVTGFCVGGATIKVVVPAADREYVITVMN
jgi:dienelactone hydrolase